MCKDEELFEVVELGEEEYDFDWGAWQDENEEWYPEDEDLLI